jgi:serine/threonine-protein kinase
MAARDPFAPGEVVASRYEIKSKLGKGGFGTVFRARHLDLGKDVALKVLNPELAANDLARGRFLKEVEATTSFVHKFAVQLREFGHDPAKNVLYFTMDLVEGETLRSMLEREKRLSEARAAGLVAQVLEVLDEAHGAGLVHRDLKPENLIVTKGRDGREEVRVLDFGIAKAVAASRDSTGGLTATGTTLGTLFYMSPEQDEGKKLDGRSDLYSLGVILYECVSGKRPIEPDPEAENQVQNFHFRLATTEPLPLETAAPGVNAAFAALTAKALAKKRDDRFANAREMREALSAVSASGATPAQSDKATLTGLATNERRVPAGATATGLPTGAGAAPPVVSRGTAKTLTGLATGETPVPSPGRSRVPLFVGVLVVLAATSGAALALNLGGVKDRLFGSSAAPTGPTVTPPQPPQPAPSSPAPTPPSPAPSGVPPSPPPPSAEEDAWQQLVASVERAGSEDAKGELVGAFLRANPQNLHAGDARALAEKLGGSRTGWFGEKLPKGLRRGQAKPVYVWDTGKGLELELVYVPAGKFVMGADDSDAYDNEKPKHTHPMEHGYWIGRTPVTWKQYLAFCTATGHAKPDAPRWGIKEDHPVVNVSWEDLHGDQGFLKWAGVVLPTEAEWEKAARGEDGKKYPWGNEAPTAELCTFDQDWNTGKGTSAVTACAKGASPYGALDMAGNVWQWCEDWYEEKAYGRYEKGDMADPSGGSDRVARGGCWDPPARYCRSSSRGWIAPGIRDGFLGFRVLLRSFP